MLDRQRRFQLASIVLCAGVFLFHLFTLSSGTMWGDDWTMYVNHAMNMAQGRSYTYPGYIFNPMYPTYAPTAYPAGYPLLLTPAAAIWGLNLTAFKIVNLLCLAGGLYLIWYWLQSRVHPLTALVIPFFIGMSPYFWYMRDHILSDIPHMIFTVLFFILYERWQRKGDWRSAVAMGLALVFVCMLRSISLVLIAAFGLHWIMGPLRLRKSGAIAMGLAAGIWLLHNALVPSNSYFQMLAGLKFRVVDRLYEGLRPYAQDFDALFRLWEKNDLMAFGKIVATLLPVFSLAGLLSIRRWTLLESYIVLYVLVIAFFPGFQGFRYLVGIFPFLLYYVAFFLENIPVKRLRMTVYAIMLIMTAGVTIQWYVQNRNATMVGNVLEQNAQLFFAYVRDSLPSDAVLVADRPRILALYANRKGTVYPDANHEKEWLDWLNRNNVTYATKAAWDNDKPDRYWARYMDEHPDQFKKIFEDRGLQVYKYTRTPD